ncbi:hypothetical protein LSTR_LSTR006110 [Laodelphax striatellus]|uniref:Endonuclease-reverse transcriptase n=1 Tax=Laodelphax striatellus TaxID=195883 RepID=A0A482WYB1_LAOST|nr:hypothetical protein LSTR_LSTR006110 [Laodelphax striatellus]
MEAKLDEILQKLNKLDCLEMKLDNFTSKFNDELEKLKQEVGEVKSQMKLERVKKEDCYRNKNVIIFGMRGGENYWTLREEIMKILTFIGVAIRNQDIDHLKRIDLTKDDGPIRATFTSTYTRNEVLRKKFKLSEEKDFEQK